MAVLENSFWVTFLEILSEFSDSAKAYSLPMESSEIFSGGLILEVVE